MPPSEPDPSDRLEAQLRLLQREAHALRGWDRASQPARLAQQVHNRAVVLGDAALRDGAASWLAGLNHPHAALLWRASNESPALLRILNGHEDEVTAVAVTPDGRLAVSASLDGTVRVWHLASGRPGHVLAGHGRFVTAVAVTPDGRLAVSGSDDCTVRVWDLESGNPGPILIGHSDLVTGVALTPDGRLAITGSADRTVRVWDLAIGRPGHVLTGHVRRVRAVTTDGRVAVSCSEDCTVRVWDLASGRPGFVFSGHEDWVTAVAVTPDGRHAVSGSKDRTVRVWDLATGACAALVAVDAGVGALALWGRGPTLVIGDAAGGVTCYELRGLG